MPSFIAVSLVVLTLAVAPALHAEPALPAGIELPAAECVAARAYPRLDVRVPVALESREVRVFFHAEASEDWYAIDLRPDADTWSGALPKWKQDFGRIGYFVVVSGPAGRARAPESGEVVLEVGRLCADGLPTTERSPTSLGLVGTAPARPTHFSRGGIKGEVRGIVEPTLARNTGSGASADVYFRISTSPSARPATLLDGQPPLPTDLPRRFEARVEGRDEGGLTLAVAGVGRIRMRHEDITRVESQAWVSAWRRDAVGGALVGIAVMARLGYLAAGLGNLDCESRCNSPLPGLFVGGAMGAALGGGLGAVIGRGREIPGWMPVSSRELRVRLTPDMRQGVGARLAMSF